MIEDDTERSNRRDRWWRAVHDTFVFTFRAPGQDGDQAQIEASARFLRMATQMTPISTAVLCSTGDRAWQAGSPG